MNYKVVTVKFSGDGNYPNIYISRLGKPKYELRNFSDSSWGRIIDLLQSPKCLNFSELNILDSKIEYWFPVKQ